MTLGAAWVWNPARWGTHDGYVDYHTLLFQMPLLERFWASRRLQVAAAVRMALGGEEAVAAVRADEATVRGEASNG